MQNQSSPVQILSPVIPNSWCPSGSFADIFNSYNQLYLNNSTINIPFLNEVTPQQITAIQQSILTIQNQFGAVDWQSNIVSVTPATTSGTAIITNATITLTTPVNSANYNISGYFNMSSAPTDKGMATWGIVGTPTTSSFTLWFSNANTAISSFTWQISNLGAL